MAKSNGIALIDPMSLTRDELSQQIAHSLQGLILKLSQRAYKLLDKDDITGLSNLLRATTARTNANAIWELSKDPDMNCADIRKLICDEYGIDY